MKKQSFKEVEFENPLKNKYNSANPNRFKKRTMLMIATPMIIVIVAVLLLMPVFSVRSIASNLLDSVGNHEAALAIDALNSKGLSSSWEFFSANYDNDECSLPQSTAVTPDFESLGFSAKSYVNVYPKKTGVNGSFSLKSYFEGTNNISENINYVYNETDLKLDLSSLDIDQKLNVNAKNEILNKADDALYINPIEFQIQSENESDTYTKKINKWYKQDYNLTEEQKDAIDQNNMLINEISQTPAELILNKDSIEAISQSICDNVDDVEIYGYSEFDFGPGDEKFNVRPIEISISDDLFTNLPSNIQSIAENLVKDETLKNNIKNKYSDINTYFENTAKINNESYSAPSEEEFEDSIDEAFESTKNSIESEPFPSDYFDFITDSTIVEQELIVYLSESNIDPSAIYSNITLIPKNLSSLPEKTRDELSQGVVISTLIYDINTGENTIQKDIPTETSDINNLVDDLGLGELFDLVDDINTEDLLSGLEFSDDEPEILDQNPGFIINPGDDDDSEFVNLN